MSECSAPCVCLCVPTFRRPAGLRKLLSHIEKLNYSGKLSVIVVDNDAKARAGAAIVQEVAPTFRFPLRAYTETRRGHTYAYNQAFVNACHSVPAPDYVAVLDDDEYPDVTGSRSWSASRGRMMLKSSAALCFRCLRIPITGWRKAAFMHPIAMRQGGSP